jgi:hypothetical protein
MYLSLERLLSSSGIVIPLFPVEYKYLNTLHSVFGEQ